MFHPDRKSESYEHSPKLTERPKTLRRLFERTHQAHDERSWPSQISSHVSLDEIAQRVADRLSGGFTPVLADSLIRPDYALAQIIAGRPLWSDRRPSDKRSALDFFHAHYPDAEALYLTWNAVRIYDPKLCQALRTHKTRNKSDRIPLLTKTEINVLRFEAKRRAGHSIPLDEAERMARVLKRKDRKLGPSRG